MYMNIVHKNSGSLTTADPEEGRVQAGADITIRAFISESRRYSDICDAIKKALAERHYIAPDWRSSSVEIRSAYGPGVRDTYEATVYANDETGEYAGIVAYRFTLEA